MANLPLVRLASLPNLAYLDLVRRYHQKGLTMRHGIKKFLKITVAILFAGLLTVFTQVGGVIWLLCLFFFRFIDRKIKPAWKRVAAKSLLFAGCYLIITFFLIPLIAKPLGRVPLPVFEKRGLQPGNVWTCILNRNYVKPELKEIAFRVAENMRTTYSGTAVNYLDANFPFFDRFPLLPHLSHHDGKKLDLSFQYDKPRTGQITQSIPSFTGYGVCEAPLAGEENTPENCEKKGYWQYSILRDLTPQGSRSRFALNPDRTRSLIQAFAAEKKIGKIFIEPHLKARLGLTSAKIRFHGCRAVRHDDHIHVQLK